MTHDNSYHLGADARGEWWSELDGEILGYLAMRPRATAAEIGAKLGMSHAAASSLLTLLAQTGKLRVTRVERVDAPLDATRVMPRPDDPQSLAG
jgi:MarR family protein